MKTILRNGFLAILSLCVMLSGLVLMQSDHIGAFGCQNGDPVCDPIELGPRTRNIVGSSEVDCPWARIEFQQEVDGLCGLGTCNLSMTNVVDCDDQAPGPWQKSATVTYQCLGCAGGFEFPQ